MPKNEVATQPLILVGEGYTLQVPESAVQAKAELLKSTGEITIVKDAAGVELATKALKRLAELRILCEKSRKEIKEPVLAITRDIDAKAKDFSTEVEAEENRVKKLVSDHAMEVERIRREAEQERIRQEREAQRQREEAERQQREAEQQRIESERRAEESRQKAAEEAAKAAAANSGDEEDIDAQLEHTRQLEAIEAQRREEQEAARQREAEAQKQREEADRLEEEAKRNRMVESAAPVAGVKFERDFEVEDIHALYKAQPGLVKLEASRSLVIAFLKSNPSVTEIPGIKIVEKPIVGRGGSR
jgi:colicin import membrane protein